MSKPGDDPLIDAALSQLPQWTPPAGFAARVGALGSGLVRPIRYPWVALLPRALGLAACVSVAAWLGGELLSAGLLSMAAQGPSALIWTMAAAALALAGHGIRQTYRSRA